MTAVSGNALTAAQFNQYVRDNLNATTPGVLNSGLSYYAVTTAANALAERRVSRASVTTEQSSSSTSYTNLATSGPAITVTTGTACLVFIQALFLNSGASSSTIASYAVSGATTVAASDAYSLRGQGVDNQMRSTVLFHTGLTAGSNTFKMQYKVLSGTGTWRYRRIFVMPF